MPRRLDPIRALLLIGCFATAGSLTLWVCHIAGYDAPRRLSQLAVAVAAGALLALAITAAARLVRTDTSRRRWQSLALLAIVLAGVFVAFVGIDSEASIRFNGDERTYVGHARQIDKGNWVRDSFIYPHLLYNLCAMALWVRGLFPRLLDGLVTALSGYSGEEEVIWILLHGVNALLAAAMPLLGFLLARRLGGLLAGLLGALLVLANALLIETNHLLLCDVPSAFFVLATLWLVAELAATETLPRYLAAGAFAGLAAGSKWPAGLVALAIVLVWTAWRIHAWRAAPEESKAPRWSWGLGLAGLAAIATLLASTPSLLVIPETALHGEKDLFFGVRLYANRDWAGIVKDSNAGYYGGLIVDAIGSVALLLGGLGLLATPRGSRWRIAIVAVYPVLLLCLALSMNVAVKRTIHPLLGPLAALLGVGLAALLAKLRSDARGRRVLATMLVAAALAVPVTEATLQVVTLATPTTRDATLAWIATHVPRGTRILREHYTPRIGDAWDSEQRRFAVRWSDEELADPHNDYLLVAGPAYSRFLDPALHTKPHHRAIQRRYEELFARHELLARFEPSRTRGGPLLELYRLREQRLEPLALPARIDQSEGWPSTWTMRRPGAAARSVHFLADGQDVTFRVVLAAGPIGLALDAEGPAGGAIQLLDQQGRRQSESALTGRSATLEVPARGKWLLRLALPKGAVLRGVRVDSAAAALP